jgi:hypothetical protein
MTDRELLLALRDEIRQLRIAFVMQQRNRATPRQKRTERRHARTRELAEATGLGVTWAAAEQVALILRRQAPAPEGFEPVVQWLINQTEVSRSARGVWNIINRAAETSAS